MDATSILKHLITEEVCFPVLKLVWDKRIEAEDFGELPKITPTHYLKENLLTTEDRHRVLCRQQRKFPARKAGAEVVVEPPIIVFQNYKFGESYSFPIVVRNVSRNSQKVAILMDESYGFKFDKCSQRIAKFPCGMCITASVVFTPENPLDDYYHKLVVSTNTSKVVVPIIGVGPRPLLNAPDSVIFADSPVRYWSIKTVNVLNVGKKTAKFTLSATGSFCVRPDKGVALPNQAFTFEVAYYSSTVATHEGEIRVRYENGEEIYIYLRGNAVNCDIKLSSSDIRCEDTYMTLQTRGTFYIENNSNITAKYYWKTQAEYDDMLRFYGRCDECPHQWKDGEGLEDALQKGEEKSISYSLLPECQETIDDVKNRPDSLFSSENFQLYPPFGEIKPNSKVEVQVIFSPTQCSFYEGIAYLDISGRETRLPFTFYGRGIGPKFKLAFDVLNVENVALGGAHTYEIPLQNISEIPGTIKWEGLVGLASGVGMDIRIDPSSLYVDPDQYVAFYVSLTLTGKTGPFEDELKFIAPESGDTFYVTICGEVTLPGIRFGSTEAHLGNLSIGFPKSFSMPLVNDSLNYVNVEVKMEQDGTDPTIDHNSIIKSFKNEKWKLEGRPTEFMIKPAKFTLKPHGSQRIDVTCYPCSVREIKNKLQCYITDVDQQGADSVATLNIRGSVTPPTLQVLHGAVQLKECFLHFPYPVEFVVKNPTELPVIYYLTQKPLHNHNVEINSVSFIGVADPWVETIIHIDVTSVVGGEATAHMDLYAIGVDEKIETLTVKLDAIPSKIEASTKMVDFGKLEVLDEKILSVDIINTSPITFPFTAQLIQDESANRGELWQIDPETGTLQSQSKSTLGITVLLKEVGYHYASVKVQMNEPIKHVIEVKMKALGVGSPLVFDPKLSRQATLDFGTIFIKQDKVLYYDVVNNGVNPRAIDWKHHGDKPPVNREENAKPLTVKGFKRQHHNKAAPGPPEPPSTNTAASSEKEMQKEKEKQELKKVNTKSNFVIHPMHAVIPPGEKLRVSIAAYSSMPKSTEEIWNLWTYVPVTKKEDAEPGGRRVGGSRASVQSKGSHGGAASGFRGGGVATGVGRGIGVAGKGPPPNEPQNLHLRPMVQSEVKLTAIFEVPGLRFSKRSLEFMVEATPTQENFIVDDLLKLENVGSLPLKITLKTKFPFTFRTRHDDHYFEESTYEVDVKKSLTFKIRFDGQHLRKELGKVTFEDRLEATCEGFQGVESIDLTGIVKFPELSVSKTAIDFGVITNGMEGVEQITVENPGSFCLTYKWYIKPGSTSIERNKDAAWSKEIYWEHYRPSINSDNHLKVLKHHHHHHHHHRHHRLAGGNANQLKALESRRKLKEEQDAKNKETYSPLLGFRTDVASNYEDFAAFIKEKMYRSRLMEFMGLKDAEYEAEDEVNYLAYYNQNASLPKDEFNTNELIDVIPLAGVVQAGQSQTFTIVFYGYPDITFRTTLVLFVEGGARKNIEIRGKTVPPKATPSEAAILAARVSASSKSSDTFSGSYDDDAISSRTGTASNKTY